MLLCWICMYKYLYIYSCLCSRRMFFDFWKMLMMLRYLCYVMFMATFACCGLGNIVASFNHLCPTDSPSCASVISNKLLLRYEEKNIVTRSQCFVDLRCCTSYMFFIFQHELGSWQVWLLRAKLKNTSAAIHGVTLFLHELFYMINHRYCQKSMYVCVYIYI